MSQIANGVNQILNEMNLNLPLNNVYDNIDDVRFNNMHSPSYHCMMSYHLIWFFKFSKRELHDRCTITVILGLLL